METPVVENLDNVRLSPNFWLREFLRSETAARMGRKIIPTGQEIENLRRLCTEILEPARSIVFVGRSIIISSGLRPLWLNSKVGGSPTSEHVYARASDFNVVGLTPYEAARALATLKDLPFNQIIYEFGQWVHVSVCAVGVAPKKELLTATYRDGKAVYLPGIVKV